MIALPLRPPLGKGVLRTVILQGGKDVVTATTTRYGDEIDLGEIEVVNAILDGRFFRAVGPDALLMLKIPALLNPVTVATLLITPLFDD
jgi:hypothetical protein